MEQVKGFRGVTYSQFDNHVGPRLIYSYPKDVISNEEFENLSDYAIVGKHLCGKLLIIKSDDIQFLNYSIAIENSKYERNTILFSFGFLLDSNIDPEPFSEVLKKVSLTFVTLELECEYLFQEITKIKLYSFLKILFHQLKNQGEIFIEIDESNILVAKLFKSAYIPRDIKDYEVPLLLINHIILASMNWDITIRHIIQYINGNNTVMEIANSYPGMDLDIVKRALRTLLYYKCIILSDKVKFTNIYELTNTGKQAIQQFQQQQHQQQQEVSGNTKDRNNNDNDNDCNNSMDRECHDPSLLIQLLKFSFITTTNNNTNMNDTTSTNDTMMNDDMEDSRGPTTNTADNNNNKSNNKTNTTTITTHNNNNNNHNNSSANTDATINAIYIQSLLNNILYILLQFKPKLNLASVILLSQKRCAGLNIRRLISFAQYYGLLRRIHEYPVDTVYGHTTGTVIKINHPCSHHTAVNSSNNSNNSNSNSSSNDHNNNNNSGSSSSSVPLHSNYHHPSVANLSSSSSSSSNSSNPFHASVFSTTSTAIPSLSTPHHHHHHHILPPPNKSSSSSSHQQQQSLKNKAPMNITLFLDGNECLDSICSKYSISTRMILNIPGVIIIYK